MPGIHDYDDILSMERPEPRYHHRMPMADRAAQFAPFAALVGYDEMVDEEARLTDRQITPGESDLDRLDRIFRSLSARLSAGQQPEISALVFIPDTHKAGGCYEAAAGRAKRLDPVEKKLILLGSGTPPEEISLSLDRILDISGIITEDLD